VYVGRIFQTFWKGHIRKRNRFLNSISILPIYTGCNISYVKLRASLSIGSLSVGYLWTSPELSAAWIVICCCQNRDMLLSKLKFCGLRGKAGHSSECALTVQKHSGWELYRTYGSRGFCSRSLDAMRRNDVPPVVILYFWCTHVADDTGIIQGVYNSGSDYFQNCIMIPMVKPTRGRISEIYFI